MLDRNPLHSFDELLPTPHSLQLQHTRNRTRKVLLAVALFIFLIIVIAINTGDDSQPARVNSDTPSLKNETGTTEENIIQIPYTNYEPDSSFIEEDEKNIVYQRRVGEGSIVSLDLITSKCDQNIPGREVQPCLEYLADPPESYHNHTPASLESYKENLLVHVYWHGPFTDKIAVMVKSFLYTQHLPTSKLYIWLNGWGNEEELLENEHSRDLLVFVKKGIIEFRKMDFLSIMNETFYNDDYFPRGPIDEAIAIYKKATETPIENDLDKGINSTMYKANVAFSDPIRFFILKLYGGLYVDTDVLFLRDMRDLYHTDVEWAYQWAEAPLYNTALLRLWRNSTTTRHLIRSALLNEREGEKFPINFHPWRFITYLGGPPLDKAYASRNATHPDPKLMALPTALFDPVWPVQDGKDTTSKLTPSFHEFTDIMEADWAIGEMSVEEKHVAAKAYFDRHSIPENQRHEAMKKERLQIVRSSRSPWKFFQGAWTYHWHNQYSAEIPPSSWMGVMNTRYDQWLKGQVKNMYNEFVPRAYRI